jgi:hypothetical protein
METEKIIVSVLVNICRERIFVNVTRKDGSHCEELDDEIPTCLNGASVQINLKNEG